MLPLDVIVAGVMLLSLIVYTLSGGADFGGGVWDLLASGPRKKAQREAISKAIGPIWEANHVWLILVIVLMFTAFPRAFAVISTALHIPLTLMLIGIVLRGSAYVFRSYDPIDGPERLRWGRVFAIASAFTPVTLGICAGAIVSGGIRVDAESGHVLTGFIDPWLAPFPFAVGGFCLALFSFLGAVYLTVELEGDADLQGDFRIRALGAAGAVFAFALLTFGLSLEGAKLIWEGLAGAWWSLPFQGATAIAATVAIAALWMRRYRLARAAAILQVGLIVGGWGLCQFPYAVVPDLKFADIAAPDDVLQPVLTILFLGSFILLPSFAWLYRVFKGQKAVG